jgi:hypothetical protein
MDCSQCGTAVPLAQARVCAACPLAVAPVLCTAACAAAHAAVGCAGPVDWFKAKAKKKAANRAAEEFAARIIKAYGGLHANLRYVAGNAVGWKELPKDMPTLERVLTIFETERPRLASGNTTTEIVKGVYDHLLDQTKILIDEAISSLYIALHTFTSREGRAIGLPDDPEGTPRDYRAKRAIAVGIMAYASEPLDDDATFGREGIVTAVKADLASLLSPPTALVATEDEDAAMIDRINEWVASPDGGAPDAT